jgi:segregation and condensation protein A
MVLRIDSMDITFVIDDFEGPLDLLLHLIKEKKMDLLNLKIEVIIDEYLNFIDKMERMNLDIASSYLVMASELIEMKSRLLLPRLEEEIEEDDPKETLVNRLIEYQKYKDLTSDFKELETERKMIYTRLPENLKEYSEENKLINNSDITLDDLLLAFKKFLERKKLEEPLTTKVTKKEMSVEERTVSIRNILKKKSKVIFLELFDVLNKEYVVVTFLAILEMAKRNELKISQDSKYGDIICEANYE